MLLCRAMRAARCTHACLLGWRTGAGGTWRHSGLFDLPYPALPACIYFFIFRRAVGEAGQGDLFSSFLYLGKRALYLRRGRGLVVAGAAEFGRSPDICTMRSSLYSLSLQTSQSLTISFACFSRIWFLCILWECMNR